MGIVEDLTFGQSAGAELSEGSALPLPVLGFVLVAPPVGRVHEGKPVLFGDYQKSTMGRSCTTFMQCSITGL